MNKAGAVSSTLGQRGEELLEGFFSPLPPSSQKVYRSDLMHFLAFLARQRRDICKLSRRDLERYREHLGPKSESTLKRKFSVLNRFFKYLEEKLDGFENPLGQNRGGVSSFARVPYWRSEKFKKELEEWLSGLYSPQTRRTYANKITLFFRWVNKAPEELTLSDFKAYRTYLEEKGYKISSIWNRFVALNRFLKWRERKIPRFESPLSFSELKLVPPSKEKGYYMVLSEEEARRLLEAPETSTLLGLRDRLVLALMLIYGLRAGEVARIRFEDIEPERIKGQQRIWVRDRKGRPGRRATTGIILTGRALEAYDAWVKALKSENVPTRGQTCLILGFKFEVATRTLTIDRTRLTKPLSVVAIENIVKRYVRQAGIERPEGVISAHALRHTALTLLARQNVRLEELKYLAGHQDVNTTMIYIRAARSFDDHPGLYSPLNR